MRYLRPEALISSLNLFLHGLQVQALGHASCTFSQLSGTHVSKTLIYLQVVHLRLCSGLTSTPFRCGPCHRSRAKRCCTLRPAARPAKHVKHVGQASTSRLYGRRHSSRNCTRIERRHVPVPDCCKSTQLPTCLRHHGCEDLKIYRKQVRSKELSRSKRAEASHSLQLAHALRGLVSH